MTLSRLLDTTETVPFTRREIVSEIGGRYKPDTVAKIGSGEAEIASENSSVKCGPSGVIVGHSETALPKHRRSVAILFLMDDIDEKARDAILANQLCSGINRSARPEDCLARNYP